MWIKLYNCVGTKSPLILNLDKVESIVLDDNFIVFYVYNSLRPYSIRATCAHQAKYLMDVIEDAVYDKNNLIYIVDDDERQCCCLSESQIDIEC